MTLISKMPNSSKQNTISSNGKQVYSSEEKNFLLKLENYVGFLKEFSDSLNSKDNVDKKYKIFSKKTDLMLLFAHGFEKEIKSSITKGKWKERFRKSIAQWAFQSSIVRRSFEKPRGYGGDYMTIELFYNQAPSSQGIGYYFDKYILDNTLAKADIYRKDKMVELIRGFILSAKLNQIKMMNLGCGGCKDLRDLVNTFEIDKKVQVLAIDQDEEAIAFSAGFTRNFPEQINVRFLKENLVLLFKRFHEGSGRIPAKDLDLVYSIGLVDYFSENVLRIFVEFALASLKSGGKLIFAHKNSEKWESFVAPDWFCDWKFYQRNKKEVLEIIGQAISGYELKLEWEKTKHMFFLLITKK